jgi:polyphosphate glucokinase
MKVLVVDIGGTNLKVAVTGQLKPVKVPSGPHMTAAGMVAAVKKAAAGWEYDAVSLGYPGPVAHNQPARDPHNMAQGWVGFDYAKAFGKPVRLINDAAMQALGSYQGGRLLFLGLGTGLGSALVVDGVLVPLELAHLPYRNNRTYEDYVGLRGLERMGREKWTRHVEKVVALLRDAMQLEDVVLGGGQTKKLSAVPQGVRIVGNENAILGGTRLWTQEGVRTREAAFGGPDRG